MRQPHPGPAERRGPAGSWREVPGVRRSTAVSLRPSSPHQPGPLSPGSCLTTRSRGCPACTGVRSWRKCECGALGLRAGSASTLTFPALGLLTLRSGLGARQRPGQAMTRSDSPGDGAQKGSRGGSLGVKAAGNVTVIRASGGAGGLDMGWPWGTGSAQALGFHKHTRTCTVVSGRETWAAGSTGTETTSQILRAPFTQLLLPQVTGPPALRVWAPGPGRVGDVRACPGALTLKEGGSAPLPRPRVHLPLRRQSVELCLPAWARLGPPGAGLHSAAGLGSGGPEE